MLKPLACLCVLAGCVHGTGISVNMVDLLWRRTLNGGRNECGEVVPCPIARNFSKTALAAASARGFRTIRFGVSGFWPVDLQLWANASTRELYWAEFDSVVADATELKVKLIPSLLWNFFAIPDFCKEPLSALMVFSNETCSGRTAKQFTAEVVSRYANNPAIAYWEIANEFNIFADLDMQGRNFLIAPQYGTPTHRTRADNFSTDVLRNFQQLQGSWIRQHDQLGRKISTGHAIPHPYAEHLRASYYQPQRDWTKDTEKQYQTNFLEICAGCDLCSLHVYPIADNRRWGKDETYLLDLAGKALASHDKRVYLGEFGESLPDRHNSSAANYNYTATMLAHMRGQQTTAAPVLATYWGWMYPSQAKTWSLFPGKDDHTIAMLQGLGQPQAIESNNNA